MPPPKSRQRRTALISGASLAGPTLAYWLTKYGYKVTVVELAPALPDGGNRVDIRGVALEVVNRMGLLEAARALDSQTEHTEYVDKSVKVVACLNDAAIGNAKGVDIEIMRGDLARLVYSLTKETVEYLWEESIEKLAQKENGVTAYFSRAKPRTFDIVIGADGIHSNTRRLAFDMQEKDISSYLGCYIAITTIPNYLRLSHTQRMFNIPHKTAGIFTTQKSDAATAMFVFSSPMLTYDRHDRQAQKKLLHEAFRGVDGWETPRLLAYADKDPNFYFDSMTQIKLGGYHNGRVVLVGDAAYAPSPASGQGSSMALTGAYMLAGEIHRANGDHEKAFREYTRKIRPYVEANQAIGVLGAKSLIETSSVKIRIRNFFIRRPALIRGMYKKIQAQIHNAANSLMLEDY